MEIKKDNLIFKYKGYGVRCPNEYYLIDDNTIAIRATTIKGDIQYSFIDKEDFNKVKICNWKLRRDCLTYYLCNSRYGLIHRIINNCPNDLQVDHIDGNGLNNKKNNLRNVTNDINAKNKHNVTGIYFDDIKGYPRFKVKWSENKITKSKDFSLSKYKTLDEAYKKAKEFRIKIECEIYNVPQVQGNTTPIISID